MTFDPYQIAVKIIDTQALESVEPAKLEAFIRARGGEQVVNMDVVSRWRFGDHRVLVLRDRALGDYAARTGEAIEELALILGMSQLAVYAAVVAD